MPKASQCHADWLFCDNPSGQVVFAATALWVNDLE